MTISTAVTIMMTLADDGNEEGVDDDFEHDGDGHDNSADDDIASDA